MPFVPLATYRLQLGPRCRLARVRALVPYLRSLGVDTVYLSPLLAARPGSEHGYDTVDPTRIDPARGSEAEFRSLARALRRRRMGLLLDFVPNHMAADSGNPAWRDVLRFGPRSEHAPTFDMDWGTARARRPRVTLPFVTAEVKPGGVPEGLALAWAEGTLRLDLAGGPLPLSPRSVAWIWKRSAQRGSSRTPPSARTGDVAEVAREAERLARRVDRGEAAPSGWAAFERALARRARYEPEIHRAVERFVAEFRRRDRKARPLWRALLARQHYRLVPWWRTAGLNYRRFFDISGLIGVRTEDPSVFAATHRWLLRRVRAGLIQGVRIDHVDGLRDPEAYLRRLRRECRTRKSGRAEPYLVVEKILGPEERLPSTWPAAGTTGYEALDRITGVLMDERDERALSRFFQEFTGERRSYARVLARAKDEVMGTIFRPETARIARLWARAAAGRSGASRGPAEGTARRTVRAVTRALPVYRTYVAPGRYSSADRRVVRDAARASDLEGRAVIPRRAASFPSVVARAARRRPADGPARAFVAGWQQWTGSVAAKGAEDTAFYRYPRAEARAEVGSDPGRLAIGLSEFHRFQRERQAEHPATLTATSTHDTKWGEDARARLVAWTEFLDEWPRAYAGWRTATDGSAQGRLAPSRIDAWRGWQSLFATGPLDDTGWRAFAPRFAEYLRKAAREAKQRTSWTHPDSRYERALEAWASRLAAPRASGTFRRERARAVRRVAYIGALYSLAQTLLRTTLPGVPDLYQGSERWNLALVDPDNRRPPDFAANARALERLRASRPESNRGALSRLAAAWPDGRLKLFVTYRALETRRRHRALFERGEYLPVLETGRPARPVLAYARRLGRAWALVAVGRRLAASGASEAAPPVGEFWSDRRLRLPKHAPRDWRSVLSPRTVRAQGGNAPELVLREVFRDLPVAMLVARSDAGRRRAPERDRHPARRRASARARA